jgi:regulator of sigma E protease
MSSLLSGQGVFWTIVILSLLIFVHELGHFVAAKLARVGVLEFGFGFPPRLVRLFKRGETEYTINTIPIGGFVRLAGEEDPNAPNAFAAKSPFTRIAVLLAGVTMNFILVFVLFALLAAALPGGEAVASTRITAVEAGSPAKAADLRVGDTIVSVNGVTVRDDLTALRTQLSKFLDQPVAMEVERVDPKKGAQILRLEVTPRSNPPPNQGALGIVMQSALGVQITHIAPGSIAASAGLRPGDLLISVGFFNLVEVKSNDTVVVHNARDLAAYVEQNPNFKVLVQTARDGHLLPPVTVALPTDPARATLGLDFTLDPLEALAAGAQKTGLATQQMIGAVAAVPRALLNIAQGTASNGGGLLGPLGITQLTGEIARRGIWDLINLTAVLSLNLAILNLLPIPGLDGGRLIFVLLEMVRGGKKIAPEKEGLVHLIGLAALVCLMLFISYFDVVRLLSGKSVFTP